jgi:regulator of replication initiation timing
MEKEMPRKLEKALQEIEQLRQENAQLRKRLGIDVSESSYSQSRPTSESNQDEEAQKEIMEDTTNFCRYRESVSIFPLKKR